MLPSIFRNLAAHKSFNGNLLKFRPFSTYLEDPLKTDFNIVSLSGSIVSMPKALPSGHTSIIVRTYENEQKYSNHHVNIKTVDPFSMGQRIYVFGHVRANPFNLDDGRLRLNMIIKGTYYRLRTNEYNQKQAEDRNTIKLVGEISSRIQYTDTYIVFTVCTNHIPKGEGVIPGLNVTDHIRIVVYDEPALTEARKLQESNRVLIEGKIKYNKYKTSEGKSLSGGFVIPHYIEKVNRCVQRKPVENANVKDRED